MLGGYAARNHFLYSSRIKGLDSYLQKLETGRFASLILDDILACTLVVPTLPDVEVCIQDLPDRIEQVGRKGPSSRAKEPDVFRFDDEQLICRLSPPAGVVGGTGTIWVIPFELQVKTVTQYAWGQATHDLVYKGDEFDWRRERLSAQLRALAEQADLLYSEFLYVSERIVPSRSRRTTDLALVGRYLDSWARHGLIVSAQRPPSPVRFAESVVELARQLGIPTFRVCREVTRYLRRSGAPVSISLFQLAVGVLVPPRAGSIRWERLAQRYWLPITRELTDLFPALLSTPKEAQIDLG